MRCAGSRTARGAWSAVRAPWPAAAGRAGAAVLAVAVLLAACSGGAAGGPGRAGKAAALTRGAAGRARLFVHGGAGQGIVIGSGGGGGGQVIVFSSGPGGGSDGRPQISPGQIPPAGSARPIPMPLDNYELISGQQQNTLATAATLLTQRCMAARGFTYSQASAADNGLASLQQIETSSLGLTSLARAQAYGYATPGTAGSGPGPRLAVLAAGVAGGFVPPGVGGVPGDSSKAGKQPPAWTAALDGGVSEPGCLSQAQALLYGSGGGDPVPQLAFQAASWTQSDPLVKAVVRAWAGCMSRRGYRYSQPVKAALHTWPKQPSRAEIATAVADVTCKRQVDLANTWLAVEAAYQQALVSQNLTQLSGIQASYGGVLQRAAALLAAPPAP
jgi:hypothetical protein